MGYFGDVWSNLTFNAGSAGHDLANSLNWRYRKGGDNDLKFVSRSAYKSVLVHVAKQLAASTLENELNQLIPRYEKYARDKMLEAARKQQDENRVQLIEKGNKSTEGFGFIECQGGHKLIAKTKYGTPVPEALILSFEGEMPVVYEDVYWDDKTSESYTVKKKNTLEKIWNPGNEIVHTKQYTAKVSFTTKTVFHIDLAPKVTMSSTKNLVLTQVQGRDFSRKELVSGGDLTYTVNGSIVSDEPGVYPVEAVKRFVSIMQHAGIIDVNYITFGILGVTRIVIKDFSLGHPDYKNVQPYSFTCVAVEPDDAIQLQKDTIATINESIETSQWDTWYKSILDNKLVQMGAGKVIGATSSLVNAGLDALVPNI